jgi:hypothetical protein
MQLTSLKGDRRGEATIEMALVSLFILFPLMAGMVDCLFYLNARYQITSALAAFDSYAWNNPNAAGNVAALAGLLAIINQNSSTLITFPDGIASTTTSYTPTITCNGTTLSQPANGCPAATPPQTEFATYSLTATVKPLIPLPYVFTRSFTISVSNQIQVQ